MLINKTIQEEKKKNSKFTSRNFLKKVMEEIKENIKTYNFSNLIVDLNDNINKFNKMLLIQKCYNINFSDEKIEILNLTKNYILNEKYIEAYDEFSKYSDHLINTNNIHIYEEDLYWNIWGILEMFKEGDGYYDISLLFKNNTTINNYEDYINYFQTQIENFLQDYTNNESYVEMPINYILRGLSYDCIYASGNVCDHFSKGSVKFSNNKLDVTKLKIRTK